MARIGTLTLVILFTLFALVPPITRDINRKLGRWMKRSLGITQEKKDHTENPHD